MVVRPDLGANFNANVSTYVVFISGEKAGTAIPPQWQQQGWRPLVDLPNSMIRVIGATPGPMAKRFHLSMPLFALPL